LNKFDKKIDVLYLDSANNANLVFSEFKCMEKKFSQHGLVLIDDTTGERAKKGKLIIPYLINNKEWELVERKYQALFRRKYKFFI
jgi:hypothetical protein